jgi:hypothetical protein
VVTKVKAVCRSGVKAERSLRVIGMSLCEKVWREARAAAAAAKGAAAARERKPEPPILRGS